MPGWVWFCPAENSKLSFRYKDRDCHGAAPIGCVKNLRQQPPFPRFQSPILGVEFWIAAGQNHLGSVQIVWNRLKHKEIVL